MTTQPTVLITGAARGIGRASLDRLVAAGWQVIAGVRNSEDARKLDQIDGVRAVLLDVTNEEQIAQAFAGIDHLDALVNNAGIAVSGPVEGLPLSAYRHQMEVNLFGQVAVTQAALPLLRASKGRVVFVSSVSGRVATPMTGAYNASKFALEALADALRMEVAPWGVRVSLVEPAQTATDMWFGARESFEADLDQLSDEMRELYAGHIEGGRKTIAMSQKIAAPVDECAAVVEKAVTASRPRTRYVVGLAPAVTATLAKVTPTPLLDLARRKFAGVPHGL